MLCALESQRNKIMFSAPLCPIEIYNLSKNTQCQSPTSRKCLIFGNQVGAATKRSFQLSWDRIVSAKNQRNKRKRSISNPKREQIFKIFPADRACPKSLRCAYNKNNNFVLIANMHVKYMFRHAIEISRSSDLAEDIETVGNFFVNPFLFISTQRTATEKNYQFKILLLFYIYSSRTTSFSRHII